VGWGREIRRARQRRKAGRKEKLWVEECHEKEGLAF
jgi:hypothetical protein